MLQKKYIYNFNLNTLFIKIYRQVLYLSFYKFIFLLNRKKINIKNITLFFNKNNFQFDKYNYNFLFFFLKKKKVNYFIYQIIFYWFKITFKGKGFRIRKFKKSKKITLNFGHSHWTKLYLKPFIFFCIKIRRQNYLIFSFFRKIINLKLLFKFARFINKYTKRGLRLKKQLIKRRYGKLFQLVSSTYF